eukprot:4720726-Ditylum_brightwellii.AAC.1
MIFSKPSTSNKPQSNGSRELKLIIPNKQLEAQELTKGKCHTHTLCMVPSNANSPTCNLAVPFYNTGYMEELLKVWQNLQAVITEQNITDAQGMYTITKSMLQGDVLTSFKNDEGVNRSQSEPNYKKTMQGVHMYMFPLYAHVTQSQYIRQALIKPYKMPLKKVLGWVNKINDWLEQFLPTNNGTPQVRLADEKLMDIVKNTMPKAWQAE